jgi:hypothetical protein
MEMRNAQKIMIGKAESILLGIGIVASVLDTLKNLGVFKKTGEFLNKFNDCQPLNTICVP